MSEPATSDKDPLALALDDVCTALTAGDSAQDGGRPHGWLKTDEGSAFLQEVLSTDSFRIFDDTLQAIGNRASAVDREQLADWMVERARLVGARQTVAEVVRYIEHDGFDAYQIALLSDLHVESAFDLGGGVKLVPAHEVPNRRLQAALNRSRERVLPSPYLFSALVYAFRQPKLHTPQKSDPATKRTLSNRAHDEAMPALDDACLCLTLTRKGGLGVQTFGITTVAGDDVPILSGFGWHIPPYQHPSPLASLLEIEAKAAKSLHEHFGLS